MPYRRNGRAAQALRLRSATRRPWAFHRAARCRSASRARCGPSSIEVVDLTQLAASYGITINGTLDRSGTSSPTSQSLTVTTGVTQQYNGSSGSATSTSTSPEIAITCFGLGGSVGAAPVWTYPTNSMSFSSTGWTQLPNSYQTGSTLDNVMAASYAVLTGTGAVSASWKATNYNTGQATAALVATFS